MKRRMDTVKDIVTPLMQEPMALAMTVLALSLVVSALSAQTRGWLLILFAIASGWCAWAIATRRRWP